MNQKKEIKNIDAKNRKIIIYIWIVSIFVLAIGTTVTYFSSVSKTSDQIVKTSDLSVALSVENSTHFKDIKPTVWDESIKNNNNNVNIAKIPFTVSSSSLINGVYNVEFVANISKNSDYTGGEISDIKYILYNGEKQIKKGSLSSSFKANIVDGVIKESELLSDSYVLYVYINETGNKQDSLKAIDFSISLSVNATQTE